MPFQFELNEVTPLTTHSNYCVEVLLHEDFTLGHMRTSAMSDRALEGESSRMI